MVQDVVGPFLQVLPEMLKSAGFVPVIAAEATLKAMPVGL